MKKLIFLYLILITNFASAQQPFIFTEFPIAPGTAASSPGSFYVFNNKLLFNAKDTSHGTELWTTDGTWSGTHMIKDINPGKNGSQPHKLVPLNNKLYFMASTDSLGYEIWSTDGTTSGTMLMKDINPGKSNSYPQEIITLNGRLIFGAIDSVVGNELWISDGTDTGTHVLKDINPGKSSSYPTNLIQFNNKIYFLAGDTGGRDLWCTDGTTSGTQKVPGIYTGSYIFLVKAALGKLIMSQYTTAYNEEIWITDGTPAGTQLLKDVVPGPIHGIGNLFTIEYQGRLLMYVTTAFATKKSYLFITDGTPAGTELLHTFTYITNGYSIPPYFCPYNGKIYFTGTVGSSKSTPVLWETDGTVCGTKQVNDINNGGAIKNPENIINYNGYLYMTATPQSGSRHLVRTDATDTGTIRVSPPNPQLNPLGPSSELIVYDSSLYYNAEYKGLGRELWSVKDTSVRILPDVYESVFGDSETVHTSTWSGLGLYSVVYGIKGDTLINCVSYKKVGISWNNGKGYTSPIGYLREDTLGGKVWYRTIGDTTDKLVIDMTLDVGDKFAIGNNSYLADTIVVDSVYTLNNKKHIDFNAMLPHVYGTGKYKFSFIEGAGSSFGLCYKDSKTLPQYSSTAKFTGRNICFYKDSVKVYSTPVSYDYDGCLPPASVTELVNKEVNIYPNPTDNTFNIDIKEINSTVVIKDITGVTVYMFRQQEMGQLRIDMSNKPRGIYIVQLFNSLGNSYGKVIIK